MTKPGWKWVTEKTALAIHDEQLAEHGGMSGVRDMALVQSALHRPQNLVGYGAADPADLAAAYAMASPATTDLSTETNVLPLLWPTFSCLIMDTT